MTVGAPSEEGLLRELRRGVRGEVAVSPRRRRAYASDFGRLVHGVPRVVVRAVCEDDVRCALAAASSRGVPVAMRGAGHSVGGQTVCPDGLLLLNAPAPGPAVEWHADGRVEIAGRERWRRVERALHRRGRAVPVLADYLGLSVGGTLSAGGYGVDSPLAGAQVDHVERLRLVLPDGSACWCSAVEETELFRHALAGMGRAGAIERVVLRTVPHRSAARLFVYAYPGLGELVRSFAWMIEGGDRPFFFKAVCSRGRFVATYGVTAASLAAASSMAPPPQLDGEPLHRRLLLPCYRAARSLAVSLWVARYPGCQRLWCDYLLDYPALESFLAHLDALRARDAFAGCLGAVYFLAVRRPAGGLELPFEAAGRRGLRFLVGLYAMVPGRRPGALERVREAARSCLDRALSLGGRPYLYGWHELEPQAGSVLYGGAEEGLRRALERRMS